MNQNTFLLEVSWEVCNKVGGINTVLRSKLKETIKHFGKNYILIGPLLEYNKNFIEETNAFLEPIKQALTENGITCQVGHWNVEEKPFVILVSFKDRYKIDELLYNLWNDFGVDSLASNFEYIEPILFATACGEVIKTLSDNVSFHDKQIITHFHEWLSGAGVLFLKKNLKQIPTIFTTHATVLGRALSSDKRCIYNLSETFNSNVEAKIYNVFAKHSLERAAAQAADCFTTVSTITADETNLILNRYPDKIVFNGLDVKKLQLEESKQDIHQIRNKLIQIAGKVIEKDIPEDALIWVTSGRFEFHNKGYDILLSALSKLEKQLSQDAPTILMFFLIAAKQYSEKDRLFPTDIHNNIQNNIVGITTHEISNPSQDIIIRRCNELNLRDPNNKIRIIYSNVYLDGADGVFNVPYQHILSACDLSLFPSLYEPWGYTPLESITYSTPTVTTNLSGFGNWTLNLTEDYHNAIYVLDAKSNNPDEISDELTSHLIKIIKQNTKKRQQIRKKAASIAKLADWRTFYKDYLDAYDQAIKFNDLYYIQFDTIKAQGQPITHIHTPETTRPRFRLLQHESPLPKELSNMRDLAYNFWWAWHENSKSLFKEIDPVLWEKVNFNPVHFLNLVSGKLLSAFASNDQYLKKYNQTLSAFNQYYKEKHIPHFCPSLYFNEKHPIAYFCMEYGIDQCLPIYSGGLGMLAGDYLKTLSDLNVPTIAIGLFYKQGYFYQTINTEGEQISSYKTANPNQIPIKTLNDKTGKNILINIDVLGRTIYCRVWEVKVGKITLYLLDTDIPDNTSRDRKITYKLYDNIKAKRLIQEIILGIGGTKLILEKLNIIPSLYHLNEGHCAFLLLERIKHYYHQGFSFHEAFELVKYSSVFTTHTSVPAGNEIFPEEMFKKYFSNYAESIGISIEKLFDIGKNYDQKTPVFSMTTLALQLTSSTNAVSKIHQKISHTIWKQIWPSLLENEIPITYVTNGVHLMTWIGSTVRDLYNQYLGPNWKTNQTDHAIWDKISSIPDNELWDAHQKQKEKLLNLIKTHVIKEYSARNESKKLIKDSLSCLKKESLIIGLARRITEYKRTTLVLSDKEKLAQILTSKERPVVLLIAGKTHPSDTSGKAMIQFVMHTLRERMFNGHIIFIENYDMMLAKSLTQGVDIWLNTPLLNNEACGTSGMKAGINACLNFSIRDGWWSEVSDHIGFDIRSFDHLEDLNKRNDMENMDLLNTLENVIVPLYYDNHQKNFNPEWVKKMKAAITFIAGQYNTHRMVQEYFDKLYCPVLKHAEILIKDDQKLLKTLASWKQDIVERFNTVKIKNIIITGLKEGKITPKGKIKIQVLLFSGKLNVDELKAEFVLIKSDGHQFISKPEIIPLKLSDQRKSGILSYTIEYTIKDTGFYAYAIRIFPYHPLLLYQTGAGVIFWG